jgi:hypothetical protein
VPRGLVFRAGIAQADEESNHGDGSGKTKPRRSGV